MKKIQWAALASLGAALSVATLAGTSRSGASDIETSLPVAPAPQAPAASSSDGFRPSEFEGVSVRERPADSSGATNKSTAGRWIALKPGAPRSEVMAGTRSFTLLRKEKGTTRLGGDKLVGAGLMQSEVATRDAKGRVRSSCAPGESSAAHAKHAAPAKKSVAR